MNTICQSMVFFLISVLSFIMLAITIPVFTLKKEGFSEGKAESLIKSAESVLEQKLVGVRNSIQSNKQILTSHANMLSSIKNGMRSFSNFFTRFNEDSVNNFKTSSLILYDNAFLSNNKHKIKDLIMKGTSTDYKGVQPPTEDEDEDEEEENEITYANIELIGFIFAKETLAANVSYGAMTNNAISNNLNIIQNEIADYFSLKQNEHLVTTIHDALKNKGGQFFYNKLVLFRNMYLRKIKNNKNKDIVVIKNAIKFQEDWFAYFPVYRNYTDVESKLKSKCTLFLESLNDLKDDE